MNTNAFLRTTLIAALAVLTAAPAGLAQQVDPELLLQGQQFNQHMWVQADAGGANWDIQPDGSINDGTRDEYDGAMYLRINGQQFNQGQRIVAADSRSCMAGPWQVNGLEVYRRIRVPEGASYIRYIEIFHNPTGQEITVQVEHYSNMGAFVDGHREITDPRSETQIGSVVSQPGRRSLGYVYASPRGEVQPTFAQTMQQQDLFVRSQVTIPAGRTAALCVFAIQGGNIEDTVRIGQAIDPREAFEDLPPALRRILVNFSAGGVIDELPDLPRVALADAVVLRNDDTILGDLLDESFTITADHGQYDIPADRVLGLLCTGDDEVLLVLTDGQALRGTLDRDAIALALPTGSRLTIPLADLAAIGWRITDAKPDEIAFSDPLVILRDGQRLAVSPDALHLTLYSIHGPVALPLASVASVELDVPDQPSHQVRFRNGSMLTGIVGPDRIEAPLNLGGRLDVSRQQLKRVLVGAEFDDLPVGLARIVLANEDELIGRLVEPTLELTSPYADQPLAFESATIWQMTFDPAKPGEVVLRGWDRTTTIRGQYVGDTLGFRIVPGEVEVDLNLAHIADYTATSVLPPEQLARRIGELIAMLRSNSYADRESATEQLKQMGAPALSLLRERAEDSDPEVRQRIREIIEAIDGPSPSGAAPQPGLIQQRAILLGG